MKSGYKLGYILGYKAGTKNTNVTPQLIDFNVLSGSLDLLNESGPGSHFL